jgi:hypothetical protein
MELATQTWWAAQQESECQHKLTSERLNQAGKKVSTKASMWEMKFISTEAEAVLAKRGETPAFCRMTTGFPKIMDKARRTVRTAPN